MKLNQLASNFHSIETKHGEIFFSYSTPIAFRFKGILTIRQNDWSTTTGKHLNAINPDKKIRIDSESFEKALEQLGL